MLDPFSAEFADALFARYPEWQGHMRSQPAGEGGDYLEVRVPRPVDDDTVGGMVISTENGEVTVQCGRHAHFSADSGGAWSGVLALIDGVVGEDRVFARFQRGDSVLGGKSLGAAEAAALIESGPPSAPLHPRSDAVPDVISLWSWRGTYDRTLERRSRP